MKLLLGVAIAATSLLFIIETTKAQVPKGFGYSAGTLGIEGNLIFYPEYFSTDYRLGASAAILTDPVIGKLQMEIEGGYGYYPSGGVSTTLLTGQVTLIWSQSNWRFGPLFGIQSKATTNYNVYWYSAGPEDPTTIYGLTDNFGGFIQWFAEPNIAIAVQAGGYATLHSIFESDYGGGYYASGEIKSYIDSNFAIHAMIDHKSRSNTFGPNQDETNGALDLTLSGEYLFSRKTPLSLFLSFTHIQYPTGNTATSIVAGLRFYLNEGNSNTLLERQREGNLGLHQFTF